MDLQFGPDGTFYLLTYGDGFFAANPDAGMYRWEYVKGQRAPKAVLDTDQTDGADAADGAVLQRRHAGSGSGRLAHATRGTSTVTARPTRPSRTRRHTYTTNGVYTAKLTVTDSTGKTDVKTTTITVGNTAPTLTIKDAGRR